MKRPRAVKTIDKRDVWERIRCACEQGRTTTLTARDIYDVWHERERLLNVERVFNEECMRFQACRHALPGERATNTIERIAAELDAKLAAGAPVQIRREPLPGELGAWLAQLPRNAGEGQRMQQEADDGW